jgi:adenine-specific DNA-methyltransferase
MPILTWLNDEEARKTSSRVPYRLLEADETLSYGDPNSENMLIQGDNLEALKALLPYYAGQVKCIYIDPPYNTQSAFEHYDDNLEHSTWLSMMYPRIELLRDLLSDDGSLWVSMDDNEEPYVKILLDEIFHRKNFVATVVWQKRTSPDARIQLGAAHDYIIVYAKNIDHANFNKMLLTEEQKKNFKNPDDDPRGPWVSTCPQIFLRKAGDLIKCIN